MHITGMMIGGIPPFTGTAEFNLDKRVNLFVGPNATGKSTALRLLQAQRQIDSRFDFLLSDDWLSQAQQARAVSRRQPSVVIGDSHKEGSDLVPWTYVPAVRTSPPFSFDIDAMVKLQAENVPVMLIEDAIEESEGRGRPLNLSYILRNELYEFNSFIVHKTWGTIMNRIKRGVASNDNISIYEDATSVAYSCAWNICSEILADGVIPSDYIHRYRAQGNVSVTSVHDKMGIQTSDDPYNSLFIGDLSAGTQGTLLWIWYLALKVADFYKSQNRIPGNDKSEWPSKPAILIIDEIENHLHPTWQRRVIPALLEHFPGLQIFATTHSPFVVAGREVGQVHQLIRDTDRRIIVKTNTEPIKGLTADEISRKYLEVYDPTDLATAEAAAELRRLRDEGPRDTEDAEAARQGRMQELRRLVDRDLLAGGPMAARRELFEQQFAEALEKYQRSRDLGQDSG